MRRKRAPVLVVGAGPVGLALAIELGSRGISCLVVERNDRVGYAPRAKTTHTRTREHFRRWGIADKLAAASPFGVGYPSDVHFVTRLGGHHLRTIENAFYCAPERNDLYSEHAQWIPQYKLEQVLREHAESFAGIELRFNCRFESCTQDSGGVHSVLRDLPTDETIAVDSDFLVGADGASSSVRDIIGARMEGTYGLSRNYNVVFRAPGLSEAHPHGPGVMYWQVNADAPSLIGPMDVDGRWFFMPTAMADDVKLTDAEAVNLIKRATGIDLPYEVLSTDEWRASRFIADRYRDRRIFLAGDACHLHPPFGGYGMNMGIADGVDLGWKIAAVLQGWGGPALLDSYEAERRPVHRIVIDESVANHAVLGNQLLRQGLEEDSPAGESARKDIGEEIGRVKSREFRSLGMVLGYRYENSPVIAYDRSPSIPISLDYVPSAAPGCLAPHFWFDDESSLYDFFGEGFTLLADANTPPEEVAAVKASASAAGISLRVTTISDPRFAQLYEARMALIGPDQHVTWRGDTWDDNAVMTKVTGH